MRREKLVLLGFMVVMGCEAPRRVSTPAAGPRPETPDVTAPVASSEMLNNVKDLPDAAEARARRLVVRLLPLGAVADETIESAAKGLEAHGPIQVVVERRLALPAKTESSQRGRYRSELLLDWIAGLDLPAGGKVLGITDVDIVAKKGSAPNWGVLGLGAIDGRMCVISTFRMKKKKGGGTVTDDVVSERLWKTAIHEVGHTIGIEHCPTRGCLMQDARGTVFTTDEEHDFCPACAQKFARAAGAL